VVFSRMETLSVRTEWVSISWRCVSFLKNKNCVLSHSSLAV